MCNDSKHFDKVEGFKSVNTVLLICLKCSNKINDFSFATS